MNAMLPLFAADAKSDTAANIFGAARAMMPNLARGRALDRKLVGNAMVTLTWGGGTTITRALDGRDANNHLSFPRARYLSQQFVEELCSSGGFSDGLIAEIERLDRRAARVEQ